MTARNGWLSAFERLSVKPQGAVTVHPLAVDPVSNGGRPKSPIPAPVRAKARNEKVKAERRAKRKAETVYKTSEGEAALIQQMKIAGITNWQREYRFDPVRMWRLDFAWPKVKLAVEVDGGNWSGGRHVRGAGFAKDAEKQNAMTLAGWRLLRYTPDMVKAGIAVQHITDMLVGLQMADTNSVQNRQEGAQEGRGAIPYGPTAKEMSWPAGRV